jgi:hypothetical protein
LKIFDQNNDVQTVCFYFQAKMTFPSAREGHVMVTTKYGVVMFGGEDLRLGVITV